MGSFLKTDPRPLGYCSRLEQRALFPYRWRSVVHCGHHLMPPFRYHDFFQFEPATGHSHAISTRSDLETPSFFLLVLLAFSLCPDANGGINLLVIGLSECSSLWLPRAN